MGYARLGLGLGLGFKTTWTTSDFKTAIICSAAVALDSRRLTISADAILDLNEIFNLTQDACSVFNKIDIPHTGLRVCGNFIQHYFHLT